MKNRISIPLCALLLALGAMLGEAVMAQPHGPMGGSAKPSPAAANIDSKQSAGTVVVRVVAGSKEKPLAGVQVALSGSGRQVARTDASGTAVFSDLAPAEYQVSALAEGVALRSESFGLPETGGVSITLSTKPMGPGRGGRPSARMMSGRARPEQNDPSGRLTVRAILGELTQSEFGGLVADIPEGAVIHLVGMHADGTMSVQSRTVEPDKEGRVIFDKLARDNTIAYYAMTIFERAGGSDRLTTQVLRMPPQVGSRMMFAGAPKNSANTGIDDLEQIAGTGITMPPPGSVSVRIFAEQSQVNYLQQTASVELIEITNQDNTLSAPTHTVGPGEASVLGHSGPMKATPGTKPGQVSFFTVRPSEDASPPIPDVSVRIEAVEPTPAGGEPTPPLELRTDAQGLVVADSLSAGTSYVAIATLHGKEVRSPPFTPMADKAQSFAFAFNWPDQAVREATFEGVATGGDKIYIAKVFTDGRKFLSLPFQLTRQKGAAVGIYMYPELLFSMHGGGELDDSRLWFQTQLSIANPGIAPLQVGESGMTIPLPKGFLGASVADEMASRVGVESGQGFLWRGPVPPGQRDFVATFALPVEDGQTTFDMALPNGMRSGRLVLEDLPGMELRTPQGAQVVPKTQPNGRKFLEMQNIQIAPRQRLVFGVRGLPQPSVWHRRVRIAVGAVAILLVLWALTVIFFRRGSAEAADPVLQELEASREALMAQLVRLERDRRHKREADKPYQKKRDKLNNQLADVYRKIDDHKATVRSAN